MRIGFFNKILGSILFISGTAIGAGMLGLPVKTVGISFSSVFVLFLLVWISMLFSAVAMLEISLWVPNNANIISISTFVLNKQFSFFVGLIYVLFLYSLISAYISGGSTLLIDLFSFNYDEKLFLIFFYILFTIPFFFIIFFGINFSDYINRFFFTFLIILYFFLTINVSSVLDLNVLNFGFLDASLIIFSLPIVVTSFGYSLLIPSLKTYLFNNVKFLLLVILIGSFIPFIVYVVWEYFIYSFLFDISNKLFIQTLFGYGNPSEKLMILIGNNSIFTLYVISFFSLSALVSSLIGVALGLHDFLFDFFSLKKNSFRHRFFITFLVFFIPFFLNIFFSNGFMFFLSYAGAFAAILLILFPSYLLWYGRYVRQFEYSFLLFGGRIILSFLFFFGFLVLFVDLFYKYFV